MMVTVVAELMFAAQSLNICLNIAFVSVVGLVVAAVVVAEPELGPGPVLALGRVLELEHVPVASLLPPAPTHSTSGYVTCTTQHNHFFAFHTPFYCVPLDNLVECQGRPFVVPHTIAGSSVATDYLHYSYLNQSLMLC